MIKKYLLLPILSLSLSLSAQSSRLWGHWTTWGDQGNGTFQNPIIPADFSDIDCIRVVDDFYAISSTFQYSPGMTLLHSKDLVNWEYCTNIVEDLSQIGPELSWQRMNRPARGIWAGTLRYHNQRFYLFFGTPDEGYFMTSAPHAIGPWAPLTHLLDEPGWDDCTVLWDEDGQACFVGTHFAGGYKTYLFKLSADGTRLDSASAVLINEGNGREASKLIKVGDWYYLIFSEHKNGIGRYVMAKRARSLWGPYDEERQLALASLEANEPNQGGIIQGPDDAWYFLTHHGSGDWSGRIVSLLPVTWVDEWPIPGALTPNGVGTMQWSGKMPAKKTKKVGLSRSDAFETATLGPQWQWHYQPRADKFTLNERKGWLRLKAFRPLVANDVTKAGNTLTQRSFRTSSNTVTVKLDIAGMTPGQKAGLCHLSSQHAAIGLVKETDGCWLEYRKNGLISRGIPVAQPTLWLRSTWGLDGLSQFHYSLDGQTFVPFGEPYQLVWGHYRGDRIGLYSFNDLEESGFVDVDYLTYD